MLVLSLPDCRWRSRVPSCFRFYSVFVVFLTGGCGVLLPVPRDSPNGGFLFPWNLHVRSLGVEEDSGDSCLPRCIRQSRFEVD